MMTTLVLVYTLGVCIILAVIAYDDIDNVRRARETGVQFEWLDTVIFATLVSVPWPVWLLALIAVAMYSPATIHTRLLPWLESLQSKSRDDAT
jgi:hypothetical protein